MGRVRGRHDVFLDHERAKIVAPESERDLAYLHSHRHPTRLKVRNVIEDDSCEGNGAQVLVSAGLRLVRHRRRVLRLARPAGESSHASTGRLSLCASLTV